MVSPTTALNRDTVPIRDDIEPVGESLKYVEDEEREESFELDIPIIETNLKNPMRRAEQEREDCGHAVYRIGVCCLCQRSLC